MPPPLALALTILFIAYLFGREFRQQNKPARALWIPCVYLLILGSRSVTEWLTPGAPSGNYAEGSNALDLTVSILLIVGGLVVLLRRQISWSLVTRKNIWVIL